MLAGRLFFFMFGAALTIVGALGVLAGGGVGSCIRWILRPVTLFFAGCWHLCCRSYYLLETMARGLFGPSPEMAQIPL